MAESIANCALIIPGIEAEIRYAHDMMVWSWRS